MLFRSDAVKKGDLLISVDLEAVKAAGYDGTLGSECFGIHGAAVGIPSLRHWNSNLRL